MIKVINKPTVISAAGNKPKQIEEFIGRVNSGTSRISIARMISPLGWEEPGQKPEFDEYSLVLKGTLHLKFKDGELDITAGEAVIVEKDDWVRYSTPYEDGAEYISICLPAFSQETVHRDSE